MFQAIFVKCQKKLLNLKKNTKKSDFSNCSTQQNAFLLLNRFPWCVATRSVAENAYCYGNNRKFSLQNILKNKKKQQQKVHLVGNTSENRDRWFAIQTSETYPKHEKNGSDVNVSAESEYFKKSDTKRVHKTFVGSTASLTDHES